MTCYVYCFAVVKKQWLALVFVCTWKELLMACVQCVGIVVTFRKLENIVCVSVVLQILMQAIRIIWDKDLMLCYCLRLTLISNVNMSVNNNVNIGKKNLFLRKKVLSYRILCSFPQLITYGILFDKHMNGNAILNDFNYSTVPYIYVVMNKRKERHAWIAFIYNAITDLI